MTWSLRTVAGFLAAVALACSVPLGASAQAGGEELRRLLEQMQAAADREQWVTAHKAQLTPELADRALALAHQEVRQGRPDFALRAAEFSFRTRRMLGRNSEAVESLRLLVDVQFSVAETVRNYTATRGNAIALADMATKAGRRDLAFDGAVVAADASYFGALAAAGAGGKPSGANLVTVLNDVTVAYTFVSDQANRVSLERLVRLTGAAVDLATKEFVLEYEQIDAALKRLAKRVEATIEDDFESREIDRDRPERTVRTAISLASLSYAHGTPEHASRRLAFAETRATALGEHALAMEALRLRHAGERQAKAGPDQLRALRDRAWQHLDPYRLRFVSPSGRIWASYGAEEIFGELLKAELSQPSPRPREVFARAESLKARLLLDRLAMPGAAELDSEPVRKLDRQALSFATPANLKGMTFEELRLSSQLSQFDWWGGGQNPRKEALAKVEAAYRAAGAGYARTAAISALDSVRSALADDEALIEYVIPYHQLHPASDLFILLVSRRELRLAHLPLDKLLAGGPDTSASRISVDGAAFVDLSALNSLVAGVRTDIRSAKDKEARSGLSRLYRLLIQPLVDQGFAPERYRRLIIVPHGPLHYVPYAALVDASGNFLIGKVEIAVAPSASVWQRLSERRSASNTWIAFANPKLASRGVDDLPYAEQEANEALRFQRGEGHRVLRGDSATKEALQGAAPRIGVLHIATHGEFPDESAADEHAIWLSDRGGRGTALSASEARRLDLHQSRLVVLSVCNGGLYRMGPADEPYGLVPAFLEAGAQNVLGTLWPLDDRFGRDFMVEFYRHLAGSGAAGALRKAALRFIGEDEYLRRWAAFTLVGSGRSDVSR